MLEGSREDEVEIELALEVSSTNDVFVVLRCLSLEMRSIMIRDLMI